MEKIEKNDSVELEMLRVFYLAWVKLHSYPRTEENRPKMEEAAVELTEAAHNVAEYRKSIAS